jgi:hypothetical protein
MRRLLGWIGGAVGGVAAYRWLRRAPVPEPEVASEPDVRAEELREKLAESRAAEPVVEPPAEPVAEEPPAAEPESPDERRRRVHDEGRAALDEMQSE